ncbi:MAG: magnesium transporter CorA family protein [Methanobacteriota archaeon]|nr:MAG: magnesium transporter CorA family protein [Euryarchaeota archaeon]
MIEILNLETGNIIGMEDFDFGVEEHLWVQCWHPSSKEVSFIAKNFQIPEEDIRDALDSKEIPYIENEWEDSSYVKVVVRFPVKDLIASFEETGVITIPAVAFLFENILITVQDYDYNFVSRKKSGIKFKGKMTAIIAFLRFLESVVFRYEDLVSYIDEMSSAIQKKVFETVSNASLKQVFHLSRMNIYLDSAIKGDLTVFHKLRRLSIVEPLMEVDGYLEDLEIDLKQEAELINVFRGLIENSSDAFASVINNNQNAILKLLTVISLVISIPATISSIYGMNVLLPLADQVYAFWLLMGLSAVLSFISWKWMQRYDFS